MNRLILLLGLLVVLVSCQSTNFNRKFYSAKKDNSINLYAFIGRKISVTEFDPNENNERQIIDSITGDTLIRVNYVMDYGFKCKYVVGNNLFNEIEKDTIEFRAYDHYGSPDFENYDIVLLYLSKDKDGNYFHQKYQYESLFVNSKGKYYSYPQSLGNKYLPIANSLNSFETKIRKDIRIHVGNMSMLRLANDYPRDYYKIKDNYAYPIRGMYLDEIIEYRLRTTFDDLRVIKTGNNLK